MNISEVNAFRATLQTVLRSRINRSGRWDGGCESRLLESGLAVPLFQHSRYEYSYEVLVKYCEQELSILAGTGPAVPGVESLIPCLVAEAALGRPTAAATIDRLRSSASRHAQLSMGRKRALIDGMLAAVGVLDWRQVLLPPAPAHMHRWVALLFRALEVLRAAAIHDPIPPVDLLLDAQSVDGSWDQHVLATIFILLALTAVGSPAEAVDRGLQFLVRQQRGDGGLPFISSEDTWVTCLGSTALAESGLGPNQLARSLRYLRKQQRVDGGWAYAELVEQSDTDDTAVCLSLLSRTDRTASLPAIDRAVDYLREIQNADGGFPTFTRGAGSEVEITAKCLIALRDAASRRTAREAERAWQWLRSAQDEDGGFATQWNACDTFPVFHVVEAIHRYGIDAPSNRRLLDRCADFLLELRQPDGGWPMTRNGRGGTHLLSTAYALSALARCGPGRCPAGVLDDGTAVLLAHRSDIITGEVPPDSIGPRPFTLSVPILTPIYTLMALNRLRDVQADVH